MEPEHGRQRCVNVYPFVWFISGLTNSQFAGPQNPPIGELHEVQKRRSTDLEAMEL